MHSSLWLPVWIDARLRALPGLVLTAIGLGAVGAIAELDLSEIPTVPLTEYLLVPVMAVGWLARLLRYSLVVAVVAAAVAVALTLVALPEAHLGVVLAMGVVRLLVYLVVLALLAAFRSLQAEREAEALSDPLTGLANVRAFRRGGAAELERCRRYGHSVSLLYLDIDSFKRINDELGHGEGDRILRHVGHVLRSHRRSVDLVARLGGDEFVVLLPETEAEAASSMTNRLVSELQRITTVDGRAFTCSIGLASYVEPPSSLSAAIADADRLMYAAKASGNGMTRTTVFPTDHAAPVRG